MEKVFRCGPIAMILLFGCTPLAPVVPAAPTAVSVGAEYEQRWYCFENLQIQDDSGCGTSFAACKNLAKIREEEYNRFGVPFAASECMAFADPICYYFRDSDTKYTRYMCHKTATSCARSYELMELEATSECGPVSDPAKLSPALRQTASQETDSAASKTH